MAKTSETTRVQSIIQRFAVELADAAREEAIGAMVAQLGAQGSGKRMPALKAPKSTAKREKGHKRSPAELENLTKSLRTFVQHNPGASARNISKGLGVETSELGVPFAKLFAQKAITKKGLRSATRYWSR